VQVLDRAAGIGVLALAAGMGGAELVQTVDADDHEPIARPDNDWPPDLIACSVTFLRQHLDAG